jgi:hypothetical protein
MLMIDLLLAAFVGSLYGALASLGEKYKWGLLAFIGYAGMTFSASASFVFIISANLGGK